MGVVGHTKKYLRMQKSLFGRLESVSLFILIISLILPGSTIQEPNQCGSGFRIVNTGFNYTALSRSWTIDQRFPK